MAAPAPQPDGAPDQGRPPVPQGRRRRERAVPSRALGLVSGPGPGARPAAAVGASAVRPAPGSVVRRRGPDVPSRPLCYTSDSAGRQRVIPRRHGLLNRTMQTPSRNGRAVLRVPAAPSARRGPDARAVRALGPGSREPLPGRHALPGGAGGPSAGAVPPHRRRAAGPSPRDVAFAGPGHAGGARRAPAAGRAPARRGLGSPGLLREPRSRPGARPAGPPGRGVLRLAPDARARPVRDAGRRDQRPAGQPGLRLRDARPARAAVRDAGRVRRRDRLRVPGAGRAGRRAADRAPGDAVLGAEGRVHRGARAGARRGPARSRPRSPAPRTRRSSPA